MSTRVNAASTLSGTSAVSSTPAVDWSSSLDCEAKSASISLVVRSLSRIRNVDRPRFSCDKQSPMRSMMVVRCARSSILSWETVSISSSRELPIFSNSPSNCLPVADVLIARMLDASCSVFVANGSSDSGDNKNWTQRTPNRSDDSISWDSIASTDGKSMYLSSRS